MLSLFGAAVILVSLNVTQVAATKAIAPGIARLSFYITPDHITSKLQHVRREILEMRFEKDGVYAVKLIGKDLSCL